MDYRQIFPFGNRFLLSGPGIGALEIVCVVALEPKSVIMCAHRMTSRSILGRIQCKKI